MTRRSFDQVRAEGAAAASRKAAAYVRQRGRAAKIAAKRSPLVTEEEAELLGERIGAIADEIERGFHL